MQILLDSPKPIPADSTIVANNSKITQLSIQLDGQRYALIKRLGRVFERTNKDILIDFLDLWVKHNIEQFPESERKSILELVETRRLEHSITHRKP